MKSEEQQHSWCAAWECNSRGLQTGASCPSSLGSEELSVSAHSSAQGRSPWRNTQISDFGLALLRAKALLNRFPKLQLDKASDCRGPWDDAWVVRNQYCLTCTEA